MTDPVRLINRSGLASALLRAGSEERPSNARLRRALSTLGTAAAVSSLSGEAAGGGMGAIASGTLGSALAKAGGGSVSMVLAAKWMGIGGLGAVVALGAVEIGLRGHAPIEPRGERVAPFATESIAPTPLAAPSAKTLEIREASPEVMVSPTPLTPAAKAPPRASIEARGAAAAPISPLRGDEMPQRGDEVPRLGDPELGQPGSFGRVASGGHVGSTEGPSALLDEIPVSARGTPAGQAQWRLAKQVSLVDQAWGAMKRNDFTKALTELANYEQQFPELDLHPEVLFVRMEAEDHFGPRSGREVSGIAPTRVVSEERPSCQSARALESSRERPPVHSEAQSVIDPASSGD